jgi:U3 small nucleolar RNA-associated protein 25
MPGLDLEEDNNTTTRLLTLLNVSALKSSKRKRTESIEQTPRVKLNKRRSVQSDPTEFTPTPPKEGEEKPEAPPPDATTAAPEDIEDDQGMCGFPRRERSPN